MDLTPQESDQLARYVSDDTFVNKQKEDLEELTSMFRGLMGQDGADDETPYILDMQQHFVPQEDFTATYLFMIEGRKKPLVVEVSNDELNIHYGQQENADIYAKVTTQVMEEIVSGRMTFQRAFMTGMMSAKGNFKTLRMLDQVFVF